MEVLTFGIRVTGQLWNNVGRILGSRRIIRGQYQINLARFPTENFKRGFVELNDGGKLDLKQRIIPLRKLGKAVGTQAVGAHLRVTPLVCDQYRNMFDPYPGVAVSPYLESGGTDGLVYRAAGISTFASSGVFIKADEMFAHGKNERVPVKSFYEGVRHLHDLATELGGK